MWSSRRRTTKKLNVVKGMVTTNRYAAVPVSLPEAQYDQSFQQSTFSQADTPCVCTTSSKECRIAPLSKLEDLEMPVSRESFSAIRTAERVVPWFQRLGKRVLLENTPITANPNKLQRLIRACLCPPHGQIAYNITKLLAIAFVWLSIITLLRNHALPSGNIWGLCVLFMAAMFGEEVAKKLRLPGLLGMLVAGFLLQNIPGITVTTNIQSAWSSALRSVALVIILLRAGLGLDVAVLRRLFKSIALLTFVPSTVEAVVGAIFVHFLLGFEWLWSFVLGFLLCGVSPAILVPGMLSLEKDGLGVDQGLPTLMLASASVENVYVIVVMSVLISAGFTHDTLTMQIAVAPIQLLIGLAFGTGVAIIIWYFPDEGHIRKSDYRFVLLFGAGVTAVFGGNIFGYAGAGPLACLLMAFLAGYRWRQTDIASLQEICRRYGLLWKYYQPILFGLIGAAVSISKIDSKAIGLSIALIFTGSSVRAVMTLAAVSWTGFNWKERAFAVLAWIPKATVQATLGSTVYDHAVLASADSHLLESTDRDQLVHIQKIGLQILTTAVLCIVLTAPLGALAIVGTQNRLLRQKAAHIESNPGRKTANEDLHARIRETDKRSTVPNNAVEQRSNSRRFSV